MTQKRVLIVPGHGGKDKGCISPCGRIVEADYVLEVGKRLADLVGKMEPPSLILGISRMTGDKPHKLSDRVKIAKDFNAHLVVCIHVDSSPAKSAKGQRVYHWPGNSRTERLARRISRCSPMDLDDGGSWVSASERGYPRVSNVLGAYSCDAILVELAFASHAGDVDKMLRGDAIDLLALGILPAILEYPSYG